MTSSDWRLWWVFFISTLTAWKAYRVTNSMISGAWSFDQTRREEGIPAPSLVDRHRFADSSHQALMDHLRRLRDIACDPNQGRVTTTEAS